MTYKTLLMEKQEGTGIITLNRPEQLNALNSMLFREFNQALTELENDDAVKAIVITGAGDKAFSAGADIHEMVQSPEAQAEEQLTRSADWIWHLATCKKPTIGAINGLAYGGGALMSSIFDIRLGCERASFRFLAVNYGRVNSTWSLPLIVGWPIAKELLFTGRAVEAEEALRIGLLNKLVPSSELMKATLEMGQTIAANDATTVQVIRQIMIQNIGMKWQEMLLNESHIVSQSLKSPSPQDSFRNFLERKRRNS